MSNVTPVLVAGALVLTALVAFAPASPAPSDLPAIFYVGFGQRDITPTPALSQDGQGNVYLGGFGLGPVRLSDGFDPIHARAIVIGDGTRNVALVSVEVQGSFAAYKHGAYGQYDIAKAVEAATLGGLPRTGVIISSDHSHRGPDTTGAWGFLPDAYMQSVADQTRDAILDAYWSRTPAYLRAGSVDAAPWTRSDFPDPPYVDQGLPDPKLRVLVAEEFDGTIRGVFGTFSAHSTRDGSGGSGYGARPRGGPDWPGAVADMVASKTGADATDVVLAAGAFGRTHPQDPPGASGAADWKRTLADRFWDAVNQTQYVTVPGVDADVDRITLTAWNAGLLALNTVGEQPCAAPQDVQDSFGSTFDNGVCVPIQRSVLPPWQAGQLVGTLVSAMRIGDVFVWGAPGELYPNAHWEVENRVLASGAREAFIVGLANDQLGYLIAPTTISPAIIATVASDNGLFNVDASSGDHLACAALALARQLGSLDDAGPFIGSASRNDMPICAVWASEDRTLPP